MLSDNGTYKSMNILSTHYSEIMHVTAFATGIIRKLF